MARTLRSDVFAPDTVGVYHCFNRIVRRSFLCGFDAHTGKDYSHRRGWLYDRLRYLAKHFALDVLGYAILSNHFHVILRNRPDKVQAMNDREVVEAWLMICPKSQRRHDGTANAPTEPEINAELQQPGRVEELRSRLSSPSWLMRQASQYMGIRCNAEDSMTGHFWESRFGMTRLLDEAGLLACLAYVDLNPLRAHLADGLDDYPYVSIGERLRTLNDEAINTTSWLAPLALASETDGQAVTVVNRLSREELNEVLAEQSGQPLGCLPMRLEEYAELLRWLARADVDQTMPAASDERFAILAQLGMDLQAFSQLVDQFRECALTAAGSPASLEREAARRGKRRLHARRRRTPYKQPRSASSS